MNHHNYLKNISVVPSVVAQFNLDANTGDKTNNLNTLTTVGTVPFVSVNPMPMGFYAPGQFSDANYYTLADGAALRSAWNGLTQWMIDMWVNPTLADGGTMVSWTNEFSDLNLVQITSGPAIRFWTYSSFLDTPAIPTLLGNWFFVRVVGDGTDRRIYYGQNLNNLSVASGTAVNAGTGTITSTSQFYLGRYGQTTIPYHGFVRNIRFFNNISQERNFSQ